mgnify:CR=1 FL=1
MYTTFNFKSKKQLKEAILAGKQVTVYQPGPFGNNEPRDGNVVLEGPHYPEPHRWYAAATLVGGYITKVK